MKRLPRRTSRRPAAQHVGFRRRRGAFRRHPSWRHRTGRATGLQRGNGAFAAGRRVPVRPAPWRPVRSVGASTVRRVPAGSVAARWTGRGRRGTTIPVKPIPPETATAAAARVSDRAAVATGRGTVGASLGSSLGHLRWGTLARRCAVRGEGGEADGCGEAAGESGGKADQRGPAQRVTERAHPPRWLAPRRSAPIRAGCRAPPWGWRRIAG